MRQLLTSVVAEPVAANPVPRLFRGLNLGRCSSSLLPGVAISAITSAQRLSAETSFRNNREVLATRRGAARNDAFQRCA